MMRETKPVDPKATPEDGDDGVNEIGAAGQSADPFVGRPVSGMPAGGPHTLGKEAHDRAREDRDKS